jgi:hypothetical protein
MQRHRRALDLGRQALVELKRVTNSVSSKDRENAIDEIARLRASFNPKMGSKASGEMADKIAEQQKIIDKVDEADLTARSRIDTEEERLEQLRRELDYEEAILNLKRRQSDASRQAADSARAWRVGETDSDKDSNQAAAAIQRIRSAMIAARAGLAAGASTPQSRAESLGVVTQDEATARNALQSMQQRNYDIDAARRQIAYDTVKALKDQTQEASKQFQFASRADQIRAASLANSIKRGGAISQDEFMMLSQGTRQALANYLPQEAPGAANEIRVNAERTRAELDAEQERLRANIEYISTSLRGFGDAITQWQTAGGPLDPLKGAIAPKPLQDAPNTRESNPVVNLNIDTIAVQVKLADQLGGLLNTYVDQRISNEVRAMEARLRQQPIPNPQGSVE